MAIVNRDLDVTQQPYSVTTVAGAVATGITTLVHLVPNPSQLVAAGIKAFGLSGSPVYSLNVLRATADGPTLIGLGATVTAVGGLSAVVQGFSITGMTNPLQTGDVLMLNSGAANTAVTGLVLTTVFKPLQDVKTYFGYQNS